MQMLVCGPSSVVSNSSKDRGLTKDSSSYFPTMCSFKQTTDVNVKFSIYIIFDILLSIYYYYIIVKELFHSI